MASRSAESEMSDLIRSAGKKLSAFLEIVRVNEGDVLLFKRSGMVGFYTVVTGHHAIEVVHKSHDAVIRICGPGDLVGFGNWYSPFSEERIQLRSLEVGELHFMTRKKFEELAAENPKLSNVVIESLCKIIALKDERIAALENHSVKGRVTALLLNLSKKFGVDTPHGRLIDLKIDRATLASLAGTSIESFARSLTDLEEENLIARRRRKILIKSEVRLLKRLS